MRPDREKLVRQRFGEQMAARLPGFEPALFGEHWPDLACYRWRIAPDLTFYLTLKFAPREDRFSVLLTWMLTERPPVYGCQSAPSSAPNKDGLSFDISLLWSNSAVSWKVKYSPSTEEMAAWSRRNGGIEQPRDDEMCKVYPRVDDAFDRINEFGLPYCKTIAEKYGKSWPGLPVG